MFVRTGLPTDAIHVETITVFPDPPVPGKDLTVTVVGTAHEVIEVCHIQKSLFFGIALILVMPGRSFCRCDSKAWSYQAVAKDVRCLRRGVSFLFINHLSVNYDLLRYNVPVAMQMRPSNALSLKVNTV